jgi:tetratricopeptide (TPR) repeat protein
LPSNGKDPGQSQLPPRYDGAPERSKEAGESSSRGTLIDISPPKDDLKTHPDSGFPELDADGNPTDGVKEMRPWNPHLAMKNMEVGDFYFKRKNYRAALDRYTEALAYKPNDALANFKMALCFDKLKNSGDAADHYEEYLKILPLGEFSAEAKKSLERLKSEQGPESDQAQAK